MMLFFSRLRREKKGDFQGANAPWIPSFLDQKGEQPSREPFHKKINSKKSAALCVSNWDRKGERRSREPFHKTINFKGLCPLKFGATHA